MTQRLAILAARPTAINSVLRKHGIDPAEIRCGADCGDGWAGIVDSLLTDLKALGWTGEIQQIKNKWGGLETYVSDATGPHHDLIAKARAASLSTCEECGEPGRLRGRWVQSLCNACENRNETES